MIEWKDAQVEKPLDDTDCLILFITEGEKNVRAPVFWHDEKLCWVDEWNNCFDPAIVLKYILVGDH